MENITYEDFKKMDMRIGWIRFVEPVEETDKLLRFEIDFGAIKNGCDEKCEESCICDTQCDKSECLESCVCEPSEPAFGKSEYTGRDVRQIVSGIREFFPEYETLIGKKALYILNLEPRKIRGVMSHGMLMAVDGPTGDPVFLNGDTDVDAGSQVR